MDRIFVFKQNIKKQEVIGRHKKKSDKKKKKKKKRL